MFSFFTHWPFRPKGYCHCLRLSVRKLYLVRTIPHHRFELESPNLQTCIIGYFWLVLKINLDFQVHLGHLDILNYTKASPHVNSSQIWARITKFALNIHPGILSVGTENGDHWPLLSRSFWLFWLIMLILEMAVIDLDLQGLLVSSTQEMAFNISTSLLYKDLGQPMGVQHPKHTLISLVIWAITSQV